MDERRLNLADLCYEGYLALVRELDERLRQAGYCDVRPAHGQVFQHLTPEGLRVTELAERAQLTRQAMTELVDHLEAAGYVAREPDPRDGRAKVVRLTARGRRATAHARRSLDAIEERWVAELGEREVAALRALLERVRASRGPGGAAPGRPGRAAGSRAA